MEIIETIYVKVMGHNVLVLRCELCSHIVTVPTQSKNMECPNCTPVITDTTDIKTALQTKLIQLTYVKKDLQTLFVVYSKGCIHREEIEHGIIAGCNYRKKQGRKSYRCICIYKFCPTL